MGLFFGKPLRKLKDRRETLGQIIILPETIKNPITIIGARAGVCYGAQTDDNSKNYKRGIDCIESGHGRTLEYVHAEFVIDGYSARVMREYYTHIGGLPARLQSSTRYIGYDKFKYVTPHTIRENETATDVFDSVMRHITAARESLCALGIPVEDSAMLLPLAMTTRVVDKRNVRNLIDMSHQRLCNRANWEYRELMNDIMMALSEYSEEWAYIVKKLMVPKCVYLGRCPEKKKCSQKGG